MITKINKIKNLGLVFADFTWKTGVPDFKQFNLIYGLNGCGKTTLTRLFDAISGLEIENLQYEFEEDDGSKAKQGEPFTKKVRVFNQDYIQKNVEILKSHANSISVLLGEENKDLITQIEADETLLNGDPKNPDDVGKIKDLKNYTEKKKRKEDAKEGKFRDVARDIGANTMGGGLAARNYRSPNSKDDFYKLTEKELLGDLDLDKYLADTKQELLSVESPVELTRVSIFDGEQYPIEALKTISVKAEALLKKTIEAEVITRLADNPDISEWVEQGMHLHEKHSSDSCEYCGQKIPVERIKQLAGQFNDADRALKQEIDELLEYLRSVYAAISTIEILDANHFYPETRVSYQKLRKAFVSSRQELLEKVTALAGELKGKKTKTTTEQVLQSHIETDDFARKLDSINETVKTHNQKTKDFQQLKDLATKKIKTHYLSSIFDDVKAFDVEIEDLAKDLEFRAREISEIQKRISDNRNQISSEHKACRDINTGLTTFLGRSELQFIPHTEKKTDQDGNTREVVLGYHIMRGDKPAVYLSEGEKTAIAFVYFVVNLKDREFIAANGIVVVDDPISSLDSNSLYQAFSFLKNTVKDCGQVFILTHNFDFLKLLINWRKGADRATNRKDTSFYMITNEFENDVRKARIKDLDKLLLKYESEYHYLFKLLKEMRDNQDGTLIRAYPVPNVARKVWDTFLMFRVPDGNGTYLKMEYLKSKHYDAQILDAIHKFTNDQSHITGAGFDPALVPETQKVVGELLTMIETLDPEHFRIINEATP